MLDTGHPGQLVALLQLCDSLFPIGAFAHSDGLEAATSSGSIATTTELRQWLDVTLDETLRCCEGPAVRSAWEACMNGRPTDLLAVDAEVEAIRPSSALRHASRAMGSRLLITWRRIRPSEALDRFATAGGNAGLTLPTAFGIVCASSCIPCRATLEAFFYTRLAGVVSSAMRLMAVGHGEAHALLADILGHVPETADSVLESLAIPSSFAPALDIATMSHQYVRSRLFRS